MGVWAEATVTGGKLPTEKLHTENAWEFRDRFFFVL